MATYYVDPAGSNTAPYDTWAKAATKLQTAADTAVAGSVVYCRGTETLTSPVDFDINTGLVKFIGCNAGGTVDGTKFELNGNSAVLNCIKGATVTNIYFENFELYGATGDGLDGGTGSDKWYHVNCLYHSCNYGADLTSMDGHIFIRCQFYSNTKSGVYRPGISARFIFCAFYSNTEHGSYSTAAGTYSSFIGCVFHDNGDSDKGILGNGILVFNCVFEGTGWANGIGAMVSGDAVVFIGNRIANLTTGINFNSTNALYGWNYFHNNTTDISNTTNAIAIPYDSDSDTNEIDSDADDGFNDVANDDFNIKTSRTLRRTAIDLGIGS